MERVFPQFSENLDPNLNVLLLALVLSSPTVHLNELGASGERTARQLMVRPERERERGILSRKRGFPLSLTAAQIPQSGFARRRVLSSTFLEPARWQENEKKSVAAAGVKSDPDIAPTDCFPLSLLGGRRGGRRFRNIYSLRMRAIS